MQATLTSWGNSIAAAVSCSALFDGGAVSDAAPQFVSFEQVDKATDLLAAMEHQHRRDDFDRVLPQHTPTGGLDIDKLTLAGKLRL